MKQLIPLLMFLCAFVVSCNENKQSQSPLPDPRLDIYVNHLGYDTNAPKKVIINGSESLNLSKFSVVSEIGETAYSGKLKKVGTVDKWSKYFFWEGDFSALTDPGTYFIQTEIADQKKNSSPFIVGNKPLPQKALPLMLDYFVSQRNSGEYEEWDKAVPFFGERTGKRDLHGGWYDASGDVSKYLSHLSYANYFNPQQAPLAVWGFLQSRDWLNSSQSTLKDTMIQRLTDEALHGANYLVRAQDPAGYFYINVFDKWTKDPKERQICAYKGSNGEKLAEYQAAYREGGGMTIAALARISSLGIKGDYEPTVYLKAALSGFEHLEKYNRQYVDDGRENIIDDYCALLAASELFAASRDTQYLNAARKRAESLCQRISQDENHHGWWRSDDTGDRPFFHASDAGLPVVALCRYLDLEDEPDYRSHAIKAIQSAMEFQIKITDEVANPFGYPRQYTKALNGPKQVSFFIPHQNETGYWWQGENARLASLAVSAIVSRSYLNDVTNTRYKKFIVDQFDWILGLNPYDMCMLQGIGRNNPKYIDPFPIDRNVNGGICNGITAGFDDPREIAFLPAPHDKDPAQNWRWPEQWVPHVAWMTMAMSAWESL